jgi:hypothetical protein
MRHGTSAIGLLIGGSISLALAVSVIAVIAVVAYSLLSAITSWDPIGLDDGTAQSDAPAHDRACDANYEGACLDAEASDYDCSSGGGDGPKYTGRVSVVGSDVYGLDRDGDGIGCE